MRKSFSTIFRKFCSDCADGIFTASMFLLPIMLIMAGASVELLKNIQVRTERGNAIQDSASSAVTLADSRGSLDWSVASRIVEEYEHNRFGGVKFGSTASEYNSRLRYDTADRETAETQALGNSKFNSECLTNDDGEEFPQYTVTLEEKRGAQTPGAPSVTFTRTAPSLEQLRAMAPLGTNTIYRAVRVDVVDQSPNLLVGMIWPCQKFSLEGNAVTFSADADIL